MHYQGLDNKSFCLLPEGVSIQITPAGIPVRAAAYMYDFLLRTLVIVCIGFILNFFGDAGSGIILLVYFLITWGYYIYFEGRNGQTPGKKKYQLRVVQDNGLPATLSNILLRNLIRPADSFPFAYALGLFSMALNKQFKRIGDWAAGTIVVYDSPAKIGISANETTIDKIEAPDFILDTEEQKVLISYVEQSQYLSVPRQVELANILTPLLRTEDEEARQKLKNIAQYYLGQEI